MCIFHKWVKVEDAENSACGNCIQRYPNGIAAFGIWQAEASFNGGEKFPQYRCRHSFKVCTKCGKYEGYGSHGKLTVVPDGCKAQIARMGGRTK